MYLSEGNTSRQVNQGSQSDLLANNSVNQPIVTSSPTESSSTDRKSTQTDLNPKGFSINSLLDTTSLTRISSMLSRDPLTPTAKTSPRRADRLESYSGAQSTRLALPDIGELLTYPNISIEFYLDNSD
ncbi:unnamed protein product [Echinostoma caproni]|uniref:Uncharacterized protein n=1 Tax=Echinostoma caproni TaxID=27848 RepID=A0A183AF43_9TREM|nr:unnamed protein product [Echinostoma caproni]